MWLKISMEDGGLWTLQMFCE